VLDEHRGGLLVGQPPHLLDLRFDGLAELLLGDVRLQFRVDFLDDTHC